MSFYNNTYGWRDLLTFFRNFRGWLVLATFCLFTPAAQADVKSTDIKSTPAPLTTAQPASAFKLERLYHGLVEAREASTMGFEQAGTVQAVLVEEGDTVEAGTVLAQLDDRIIRSQLVEAQAALAEATALEEQTKLRLQRIQPLTQREALSQQALDDAQTNYQAAWAAMRRAQASVDRLTVALEKTQLIAPFDAHITSRQADRGQVIQAGQTILTVQTHTQPQVRFAVGGQQSLIVGQTVQGTLANTPDTETFPLRIAHIVASITPRDRLRTVLAEPVDQSLSLIPGDLVHIRLSERVSAPSAATLPLSALTEDIRGLWAVYVATPSDDAYISQRQVVELLAHNATQALVRGLAPGMLIVADGVHRLVPNQLIHAQEPANAQ